MTHRLLCAGLLLCAATAPAETEKGPFHRVLVELFTSQG
jgi:hypothetical protein